MTETVTAKAKVYIGGEFAGTPIRDDYEAQTWTEIGGVTDLGKWGAKGTEVTAKVLSDGHLLRLKGTIDSGTVELVVIRNTADAGQNLARAAAKNWSTYLFKVELNDKPTPTGTNSIFYFRASVMSAEGDFGDADNIVRTNFALGITGEMDDIDAAAVVTFAPVAGALTGGTVGVAYTTTVTASGGLGTVSYAVTSGTLPGGLTLNAATGAITGTPSGAGTSNFTITATYSGSGEDDAAYSIVIAAA